MRAKFFRQRLVNLQELESIHAGHIDVQENERRWFSLVQKCFQQNGKSLFARCRANYLVCKPTLLHDLGGDESVDLGIVDDERFIIAHWL